jgi:hypothetical protein
LIVLVVLGDPRIVVCRRVRLGRCRSAHRGGDPVSDILDDEDPQEAIELCELLADRLYDWCLSDADVTATSHGIDIGFAAAFASTLLHWTTRSLINEAVTRLITDEDLPEVAEVRLHELLQRYIRTEHIEQLPEVDGD